LQVYHFEPGGIDTKQPHSVGPGKTTYVFNSLRFFYFEKKRLSSFAKLSFTKSRFLTGKLNNCTILWNNANC